MQIIKFLNIIIIVCIPLNGFSQFVRPTSNGNVTYGGDIYLDFGFQNYNYTIDQTPGEYEVVNRNIGISANPSFGYFVYDGITVGISPTFGYSKRKIITSNTDFGELNDEDTQVIGIGLNLFIKYYFRSSFFCGLSSGFSFDIYKSNQVESINKFTTYSLSPEFGYAIFINSNISFEPSLNYKISYSHSLNGQQNPGYLKTPTHNLFISMGFHLFL